MKSFTVQTGNCMPLIVHPKLEPVYMLSHQLARSGLHLSAISYRWLFVSRLTQLMAPGNLHARRFEASQFTLKLARSKPVVQVKHQRQVKCTCNAKLLPRV